MLADIDIVMRVNRERKTIIMKVKCPCNPCRNSLFYALSLMVKGIEEEIQPSDDRVDITRGWNFEQLQQLLPMNCVRVFSRAY